MSGITAMGTTFNLPNYHGELFAITPNETPFLSMIGGLTGGGMSTDVEAEWQLSDLRDPSKRERLEGAAAQTSTGRVRANVRNVAQIHQETVSVSYTKQAAVGMHTTPSSAPYRSGSGGDNPVANELDWQVAEALKGIALDVNYSFWNGLYANPTTNATPRRTRGIIQAAATNATTKAAKTVTGASSATDTITGTHSFSNGDKVVFTDIGDATNIVAGRVYYVVNISTTVSFKVSLTSGGSAITLGTSSANLTITQPWSTTLTTTHIDEFVQGVYDNGGASGMPVFAVNSRQKRALTAAYAASYGQAVPLVQGERIGGVSVETVLTDFGQFGVMLDRHVPQDAIVLVSMDQCQPFFLNVPGKGVFFEEPLAKVGASDEVQLYGEIGLKYGNEKAHGVLRGLAV